MLTNDIQALKSHFVTNWNNAAPVVYDNQPNTSIAANTLFVRFSVRAGASMHYAGSAQTGQKLQLGRVWLQIFLPHQTGEGAGLTLADTFATMFRNKRLGVSGNINLKTEEVETYPVDESGYYLITISIPWESYSTY